ncbi:CBASS cGAMP-activated phospholipase [Aliiglaciecola sp. LCG003]|uniref:CBASS cGAMP-activated phospholipase n=1 Tax=Aliiglaciecola sp. LCG003 TaxID=3053655 RepID=UPI00257295E1|nr:CBASS cGAMP-activated phospholipase [Aliiglaciecola sp. LCG003]WJG08095.1 CBASS cGAMP-activated phospholipase [Aliiglaciecola sp. LCG003]
MKHGKLLDNLADDLDKTDNSFKVLALTGGGYRGLFSGYIATMLEEKAGRPLNQCFDLICGTSIGGIIATGLAYGIPAATLVSKLREHGEQIFAKRLRRKLKSLFTSSYPTGPLEAAINSSLIRDGEETTFSGEQFNTCNQNPCKLMLTSIDHSLATPTILGSKDFSYNQPTDATIMDAMLSTSAAPTFFKPHVVNKGSYLDGGLIANAPDALAITRALKSADIGIDDIHMVSIGTANSSPASAPKASLNPGSLQWLAFHDLFQFTLHCQEQLAIMQARDLLGKRYIRINPVPSTKQSDYIALDKANHNASNVLETLARSAILDLSPTDKTMLRRLNIHV